MNSPARLDWKASYLVLTILLGRRRRDLGISQKGLAAELHCGRRTFQRWEAGRAMPPSARLFQWAAALGVGIAPHLAQSGAVPETARPATLGRTRQRATRRVRPLFPTGGQNDQNP